jgi:outer membrane protein assembly factor BamB
MAMTSFRTPFLAVILILQGCLLADDWPQWRGPERTGISRERGLLPEWPQSGPSELWRIDGAGDGYGTPAVAGGLIFVIGNRGVEDEFVQAFSAADGKLAWSYRLGNVGNPDQQPPYPSSRSTPTIDGKTLYALSSDGDLVSLQASTGKLNWRKSLRADFDGVPGKWAYAESPLVDGDALIVAPGGKSATLAALHKKTGAIIWKSEVPGGESAGYASAIRIEAAGRRQYVQFLDKGVVGVDARTGQFLWRYDKTASGPANIPTPVGFGNYVYSSNARRFGGALVQLHAKEDSVIAEEVYFEREMPNTLGGQVLLNGILYGTNSEGLAAGDFLTGKLRWKAGGGPGSVLYADGRLYVHGEDGQVVLVEATPDAYREKGRFTPSGQPKHTRNREMAWSYPVVANGRLYIRDLGTIWCYDIRGKHAPSR